jgi:hypothetical protein
MRRPDRSSKSVVATLAAFALALPAAAAAHVQERSGPFRVTMGWGDEPAYSGSVNSVDVAVADASGAPVRVSPGALDVEVSFGQAAAVTTLPLEPGGSPGKLRATIIPTRPGTYRFHVTGSIGRKPIDARVTCSGSTFDCVTDPSAVQFPTKDPSNAQLAERVERGVTRAERAANDSGGENAIAIAALILAALALAAAATALVRQRRA